MKTIEKLKAICDPHRVSFTYSKFGGEWDFDFAPPIGHVFDSTGCMSCCYSGDLKGVIPFIKAEFDPIATYEDHEYWDKESPDWRDDIKAENKYWEEKERKNDQ